MLATEADAVQHVEHGFIGAAMRRAPQRRYPAEMAAYGFAPVLPAKRTVEVLAFCSVIRGRMNSQIQRLGRHRIDRIRLARHGEEHVEHVRAVAADRCADKRTAGPSVCL